MGHVLGLVFQICETSSVCAVFVMHSPWKILLNILSVCGSPHLKGQTLICTGAPLQEPVAMGANIIMNSQQDFCISDELLPQKGCHLGFFNSDLKFSYKPSLGGSGCKTCLLTCFIAGIGRGKWWFESRLFWSQLGTHRRWHWVDEARVKSVGNLVLEKRWYKSAKWGIAAPLFQLDASQTTQTG